MPKKDFAGKTADVVNKYLTRPDETTETETPKTSKTSKTYKTSETSKTSKTPKPETVLSDYHRLCLRITQDDKAYLDEASYQSRLDVTNYIRKLIQADRDANNAKKNRRKS